MKYLYNKNLLRRAFIIIFLFGLSGVCRSYVSAEALPPSVINSIGQCGDSTSQFNVLLKQVPSSAQLYIKLNSSGESGSNVTAYFQSFSDGQCHLLGTPSPVYGRWSKVDSYNLPTSNGGAFVVTGSGLEAPPYQAEVSLLILPNPAVCTPTTKCQVTYQGYKGVLSPQIISSATDQVAVYVASPLSSVGYSKVTYYSDDQFLYDSKQLRPLNRNYLGGGTHNVSIQVMLSNQQTFTISQTINMGTDFTGTLYLKSLIYRSQNKVWIFVVPVMILIILLLLLWIARLIYKHHRYAVEHGLDKLNKHSSDDDPDPPSDIVIGG